MACPAPTSRSSGGRSAVITTSGTRASRASTTAGIRFAAAVPEVHVTVTGLPVVLAMPSATKPAERSSRTECDWIRGSAASVKASGAFREAARPGTVPVGYSMGARLVLHRAVREPERFAALATVGARAGIDDPDERERRRAGDEELAAWMERSTIEEVVARWERLPV